MKFILTIVLFLGGFMASAEAEYQPAFHKRDIKNSAELQSNLQSDLRKLHSLFFVDKKKIPSSVVIATEDSSEKPE